MNAMTPPWPRKTREIMNHHFDSTVWNDFAFRGDDVVIATYAKSGTTWMQQIIGQLIFQGDPAVDVAEISPWLDLRVPPKAVKLPAVEAQAHRRSLKNSPPGRCAGVLAEDPGISFGSPTSSTSLLIRRAFPRSSSIAASNG